MFAPVVFPPRVEPLVRFIEETEPRRIVEATCEKLRGGTPVDDLLLASCLAATRSCDLPPVHHGGAVHVISSVHAVRCMANALPEGHRFLPVVQNVQMCNKHIHSVDTGPYILARPPNSAVPSDVEDILAAMKGPIAHGAYNACDRYFLTLLEKLTRFEVLDLLLRTAIPKNRLDDHNLLFPVFTWRVTEYFGWEYGKYLIRPAVRFVTRAPGPAELDAVDALIDQHGLLEQELRLSSGDDETRAVAELGIDIGETISLAAIPDLLARALAGGLSLQGAGEALSLGASMLFLRWQTRRPMDVHLNIAANVQRYLLSRAEIPVRTKLRALLVWQEGPDVRMSLPHLGDILEMVEKAEEMPVRSQSDLLREMEQLFQRAALNASDNIMDNVRPVGDEVDQLMLLAYRYASYRHKVEPLLNLLAGYVCRDESSEMHTYEHHQAMREEIENTRPDLRWTHLIAAVKGAAISISPEQRVFSVAGGFFSLPV